MHGSFREVRVQPSMIAFMLICHKCLQWEYTFNAPQASVCHSLIRNCKSIGKSTFGGSRVKVVIHVLGGELSLLVENTKLG